MTGWYGTTYILSTKKSVINVKNFPRSTFSGFGQGSIIVPESFEDIEGLEKENCYVNSFFTWSLPHAKTQEQVECRFK